MYRVLRYFEDLQDGRHPYSAGDEFPRAGLAVSDERIIELKSPSNRQGEPLIEFVPDAPQRSATKARLLEVAAERGVDVPAGATKAEIYAILEGAE